MQNEPVVLCPHDTIELNFNGQETGGLGTLSRAAGDVLAPDLRRQAGTQVLRGARHVDVGAQCNGQDWPQSGCRG